MFSFSGSILGIKKKKTAMAAVKIGSRNKPHNRDI